MILGIGLPSPLEWLVLIAVVVLIAVILWRVLSKRGERRGFAVLPPNREDER
jgi:hypothetical protein